MYTGRPPLPPGLGAPPHRHPPPEDGQAAPAATTQRTLSFLPGTALGPPVQPPPPQLAIAAPAAGMAVPAIAAAVALLVVAVAIIVVQRNRKQSSPDAPSVRGEDGQEVTMI